MHAIDWIRPMEVAIGYNSIKKVSLPEPPVEKTEHFIRELESMELL